MTMQDLVKICLELCNTYEDHPFGDDNSVIKHNGSRKMFALIMNLRGQPCINLKLEPMEGDFLRGQFESISPGYHMNKMHWNTVYLNGDVPLELLRGLIKKSYDLTKSKRQKK